MRRFLLVALKVAVVLLVIGAAGALTATVGVARLEAVDSGVERFTGPERVAAEDAIQAARGACGSETGERVLRRRRRIITLEILGEPGAGRQEGIPDYRAEVQAYTLFGIPTTKIEVGAGGSISCFDRR
ncbi:MAG: hypothetical protein QJR03_05315 [Sphaerobacter sp.]|nr:hypothetical protein [Sphaerobacter sp.]